ncbi:MAG: hypothetical protein ACFCAD_19045 [Pleurocapsa sp.]
MQQESITIAGIVQPGHQVASGIAKNSPYALGTIEMQLPHFQKLGLDLSNYFLGTLNISITPHKFEVYNPKYTFPLVKWHPDYPAETFSFSPCQVVFNRIKYQGLIYYPHPETKIGHFQADSIIEVIVHPIPKIKYGDAVELKINSSEIAIA